MNPPLPAIKKLFRTAKEAVRRKRTSKPPSPTTTNSANSVPAQNNDAYLFLPASPADTFADFVTCTEGCCFDPPSDISNVLDLFASKPEHFPNFLEQLVPGVEVFDGRVERWLISVIETGYLVDEGGSCRDPLEACSEELSDFDEVLFEAERQFKRNAMYRESADQIFGELLGEKIDGIPEVERHAEQNAMNRAWAEEVFRKLTEEKIKGPPKVELHVERDAVDRTSVNEDAVDLDIQCFLTEVETKLVGNGLMVAAHDGIGSNVYDKDIFDEERFRTPLSYQYEPNQDEMDIFMWNVTMRLEQEFSTTPQNVS